jgi:hypothetical protein
LSTSIDEVATAYLSQPRARWARYKETVEVRAQEFASHFDDTALEDGTGG